MSGNFYDFDKDEIFSEIYINKPKKKPIQKEYEIEIPAPRKIVATPVDSPMPSSRAPQRRPKKARKKMSSTAIAFSIMGIAISCVLVFIFSTLAVIFGWKYIPKFDKNEKSVVESVEKIEEYINVSEDGNTVEVVPYYRETEGDDAPPTQNKDEGETSEEEPSEETSNSDDEVINID